MFQIIQMLFRARTKLRGASTAKHMFETDSGILARNLHEEKKIIDELFSGFMFDAQTGKFIAKTEVLD